MVNTGSYQNFILVKPLPTSAVNVNCCTIITSKPSVFKVAVNCPIHNFEVINSRN